MWLTPLGWGAVQAPPRALEETGDAEAAGAIYDALAVYNFNGVGYAMIRKDVLERAAM